MILTLTGSTCCLKYPRDWVRASGAGGGAAGVSDMVMEASPSLPWDVLPPWDEEHAATATTRADAASALASFLNLALGELTTLPPGAGEAALLWSMLSPFANSFTQAGLRLQRPFEYVE